MTKSEFYNLNGGEFVLIQKKADTPYRNVGLVTSRSEDTLYGITIYGTFIRVIEDCPNMKVMTQEEIGRFLNDVNSVFINLRNFLSEKDTIDYIDSAADELVGKTNDVRGAFYAGCYTALQTLNSDEIGKSLFSLNNILCKIYTVVPNEIKKTNFDLQEKRNR